MPIDPEQLADEFIATIEAALAPLKAQLKAEGEARAADRAAHQADHDRLVALETEVKFMREIYVERQAR